MADLIAYGLDDTTGEWVPLTAADDLVDTAGVNPTPGPHLLGGAEHSTDTLANLNTKVSDATLDDVGDPRPPSAHASDHQDGGSDEVATATPGADVIPKTGAGSTLAAGFLPAATESAQGALEVATQAEVDGGTDDTRAVTALKLATTTTPVTPKAHTMGGSAHSVDTIANLNSKISDATLDDSSATRAPSAHATNHQHGGSDEVATATPSANAIPKANGSGKLDSGWLVDPATKEVFFAGLGNTTRGDYRTRNVGSTGSQRFIFKIPHDFTSITGLVLVGIPTAGAAGAGKDIDLDSDYGANGQNFATHSETDTTSTYNLGSVDVFFELDLSGVFTSVAAGDYCGVLIDHKGIGGSVDYLGIRLRYA